MMSEKKILVIDDEPDVVCYLSMFLADEGFTVITAQDGPRGLRAARDEKPDIITLDITMPGMSGVEVYTELRRDHQMKKIPVIIITGVVGVKKLMEYREVPPPEEFMQKPIDRDILLSMIEKHLNIEQPDS